MLLIGIHKLVLFQPIGFDWINTTCATNGYNTNVIRETGLSSNTTRQLVAHEIGHNFGCGHTSGFIMNPAVNNANTWARINYNNKYKNSRKWWCLYYSL
ncbi:MAG: hypothetical protein IPI98_00540 [Chitinophagaceae bacterium]|nr:hypothetical protein [Chitinophagaceae bacterium]